MDYTPTKEEIYELYLDMTPSEEEMERMYIWYETVDIYEGVDRYMESSKS